MEKIKQLQNKLEKWNDFSLEGLRKRTNIQTRVYELKKQEELKKTTRRRLGVDDGSYGRIE